MRKKWLCIMLMVAMVITILPPQTAQAEVESQYRNPLMRGADPTIARDADGFYYCGFATDNDIYLKKAETVLGISTAKSRLVWKKPANFGYVWGPYIYRMEGKWYIYFASGPETDFGYGHPSTYVLENESPDPFEGTWELKGSWSNRDDNGEYTEKAGLMNAEGYGLPCGVVTIGGERYYSYTKYFYYEDQYLGTVSGAAITDTRTKFDECPTIVKMLNPWTLDNGTVIDPATGELSTGTECTLARPIYDWEKHGDNIDEGCAVVEKDGKVYFAYSASSFMNDNYAVGVSYADLNSDLLNPDSWQKLPVPLMQKSPENSAYGPGSPLFVKSEDGTEDWLIHHAGPVGGQTGVNRWVRATPVSWTDNGFVNVGIPSNPGTVFDRPSGEEKSEVLEAEDATLVSVEKRIISDSARSSGSGNIKFNEAGGYVEFDVEAESSGMYSLDFRYNNVVTGSAITAMLTVNDIQQRTLSFESNGDFTVNMDILKVYNIALQEGTNRIRLTAPAPSELILDALTIKKTTLYEAEDASLSGGVKASTEHSGYSGNGYVDNLYTNGTGVAFTVMAPYTGNYSVDLRYCNGFYGEKINKSLAIYVNGVRVKTADCFYGTSWSDWQDRYDNLNLKQGVNTIEYKYDDASLGNVNIDYIAVTDAVTMTYEAEQAELSGGAGFAQDHSGYTGTGFVGGLWQDGAVEFHVNVETAATYDVSMKYALGFIGETRNMNLYINGESKGTITFGDTAGWDNWGEKVVAMELNEGSNTIQLTREGAGQGDINLDNIHLQRRIPWSYQAENAAMLGGAHKSDDHLWYEGTGFAGGFESAAGTEGIEFTVNVPYTGTHTATVRYSGAHESNITMSLYVNGVRINQIEFPPTETWDTWDEVTYDVELRAGDNTIKILREITDSGCFNIDSLTIDKYSSAKSSLKKPGLVSGTVYVMKSKTSGKAADVAGYSREAGALVNQWNYLGNINQLWELLDQGNGYWKLMSSYSGHMLDVAETTNYFTCQQTNNPGSFSQQWKIEQVGDFYKLTNRQYDMVLEVVNGLTSNGTMIRLAAYEEGADRQLWNIADGFDATGIKPGEETPGEETPGGNTPGEETPGGNTPGEETPGGNTPGEETPGGNTPGEETPGGNTPGGNTPGGNTPGGNTPGEETPGGNTPGEETPGGNTPGGNTPGGNTPGGNTPGGNTGGDPSSPTKPTVPVESEEKKDVELEEKETPKTPEVKPQTEVTGKVKIGKKDNILSWEEVEGATKYVVYACKTGSTKYTKVSTIKKGKKLTFTHKNVKGQSYKYYIQAYGMNEDGKTVKLMKSDTMQTISSKDKKTHYMTSNMKVAKISDTGKITAVGSGECTIYVYLPDGKSRKIKISIEK